MKSRQASIMATGDMETPMRDRDCEPATPGHRVAPLSPPPSTACVLGTMSSAWQVAPTDPALGATSQCPKVRVGVCRPPYNWLLSWDPSQMQAGRVGNTLTHQGR